MKELDKEQIPNHIAIIMDGNGRWAKQRNMPRVSGHKSGVKAVREATEGCAELGVKYLTLYAFSTENWNRPRLEVDTLMMLLVNTIKKEIKTLQKQNIRLRAIGDLKALPKATYQALQKAIEETAQNDHMDLVLALNYSGRWDILQANKRIAEDVKNGILDSSMIDSNTFKSYLSTSQIPDPELLIRTSGEIRLSNFLLWETAYTEFFFTDIYWPDFNKSRLKEAIYTYQNRERRFGKTSEQLS